MRSIIIILVFVFSSIVSAKEFIVQKPVIFLTSPQKSKYEEPVLLQRLIEINNSKKILSDKLNYNDTKKLVSYAKKFNKRRGIANSNKFRNDCSGFVRKVFYKFNIELFRLPKNELRRINGSWVNGSELIWKYCKKYGSVFIRKTPKIGDIVFFDNTHDRNKNKKYDDYFTHVGIVIKVDKDKTVHYIHKANSGIKISRLNTSNENTHKKNKKTINDYLRKRGSKRLSAQLLRGYGSLYSKDETLTTSKDEAPTHPKSKTLTHLKSKTLAHPKSKASTHPKSKTSTHPKSKTSTHPKSKTLPHLKSKTLAHPKSKTLTHPKSKTLTHPKNKMLTQPIQLIQSTHRKNIVKKAVSYIGKKLKKEEFAIKVYSDLGFSITDDEFNNEKYAERKIFWSFKKNGKLFSASKPKPGDLIFFDKLNGKKYFLNVAVIEKVDDYQIKFIYSSNGVIKRAYLNNKLWKKHKYNKTIVNSYLVKDKNAKRKLSSHFFRRFGSLFVK